MTRFIHDRFAKDYLEEALSPLGIVTLNLEVSSEVRFVDVFFTPTTVASDYTERLGTLGKMATSPAIFEPFRNPVSNAGISSCLGKLFDVRAELERRGRRENLRVDEIALPNLWILTPTASADLLEGFHATLDLNNWLPGIYFLGKYLRSAIVAIHQLPVTEETLWLRLLGRGKVQQQAIAELTSLPFDNPLRTNALELVYQLQSNLATNQSQSLDREDRELVMAIAPVFQQKLAEAEQKGRQEGRQEGTEQGRQEAQRSMLENFWQVRFGKLDLGITDWFAPVSVLPAAEFTTLFLQLSTISADETGKPQALRLLAENVLKFYLGEFDDSLANLISILLERSPEDLSLLLPQLPQLSIEELRAWLNDGK